MAVESRSYLFPALTHLREHEEAQIIDHVREGSWIAVEGNHGRPEGIVSPDLYDLICEQEDAAIRASSAEADLAELQHEHDLTIEELEWEFHEHEETCSRIASVLCDLSDREHDPAWAQERLRLLADQMRELFL